MRLHRTQGSKKGGGIIQTETGRFRIRGTLLNSQNSGVKEIEKLSDTLDRHFEGIVLWHETSLNNGLAEGLNSVIQSMKTASRGFRNPSSMIALAFLRSEHKYELRKISDMKRRALPQ